MRKILFFNFSTDLSWLLTEGHKDHKELKIFKEHAKLKYELSSQDIIDLRLLRFGMFGDCYCYYNCLVFSRVTDIPKALGCSIPSTSSISTPRRGHATPLSDHNRERNA